MKKRYEAQVTEIQDISAEEMFALKISNISGQFDGGEIGGGDGDGFFPSANEADWFEENDPFFDD